MIESLAKFHRCEGCPIVLQGTLCRDLQDLVGLINIADPDFLRAEVACKKVGKGARFAQENVTITRKGAVYGLGKAADAVYALLFDIG